MYPSTSKYARRGNGHSSGRVKLPLLATRATPGSPEKVCVLEERARNHQSLWHPDDASMGAERYCLKVG
jgi:hypothetical protein